MRCRTVMWPRRCSRLTLWGLSRAQLLGLTGTCLLGCDHTPARNAEGTNETPPQAAATVNEPKSEAPKAVLLNERRLGDDVVAAGQPDRAGFESMKSQGVTTVVNLRMPTESGFVDSKRHVEELGMTFVSLPVSGAAGLTEANAKRLDQALSSGDGKTLVHCRSGNRVAALLGLRAFHVQGKTRTEALKVGKKAGLTKMKPALESVLEKWCEKHASEDGAAAAQCEQ